MGGRNDGEGVASPSDSRSPVYPRANSPVILLATLLAILFVILLATSLATSLVVVAGEAKQIGADALVDFVV